MSDSWYICSHNTFCNNTNCEHKRRHKLTGWCNEMKCSFWHNGELKILERECISLESRGESERNKRKTYVVRPD